MPDVPRRERIGDIAGRDRVPYSRAVAERRASTRRARPSLPDDELGAEDGVHGVADPFRARFVVVGERRHLAPSVQPRVRPASHGKLDGLVPMRPSTVSSPSTVRIDGSRCRPPRNPVPSYASNRRTTRVMGRALYHRTAYAERSTNSIPGMGAPSPLRGPSFRIRV